MRDADAGEVNESAALAIEFFHQPSLRKIARSFYLGKISRAELASFAKVVIETAERGNEVAVRYLRDGAVALANLAMHAMRHAEMQSAKVAFIGGMTQSATYREQMVQQLKRLVPQAQLVHPRYDAAAGALILAYKQSGTTIPERIA
jgi:N-acetylglucosamine kinase-like BadF-type ATPase